MPENKALFSKKTQRWYLPLTLNAFFNPISREALRETLDQAEHTIKKADEITAEHNQLTQKVKEELARTSQRSGKQ